MVILFEFFSSFFLSLVALLNIYFHPNNQWKSPRSFFFLNLSPPLLFTGQEVGLTLRGMTIVKEFVVKDRLALDCAAAVAVVVAVVAVVEVVVAVTIAVVVVVVAVVVVVVVAAVVVVVGIAEKGRDFGVKRMQHLNPRKHLRRVEELNALHHQNVMTDVGSQGVQML